MSGSGGGGFGGSSYSDPVIACENLKIDTHISSPREDVIAGVNVGDVLQVELEDQFGSTVVVLTFKGQKAGGITSPHMKRLRECIAAGTIYFATVTARSDGQVQVQIKPMRH